MKKALLLLTFCSTIFYYACNKNNVSLSGQSKISIFLTDGPGVYSKVNIDIQDVEVNTGNDSSSGWQSLQMIKRGVYNLLDFNNGMDTLLATGSLPAGKISQIRLVLGSNNSIVVDGVNYSLETPSAQQSGLKLNLDVRLTAGIDYQLWLDFDAGKSVVSTGIGSGKFILKPVIRAFTKATSGAVKGTIDPPAADANVYAINNTGDTVATAFTNAITGRFILQGLSGGNYDIAINGKHNYNDTTYTNVAVSVGSVTDIGTVALRQ